MVPGIIKQRNNKKEDANHKVTEYFSVRKSYRRTKGEVKEEKRRLLEYALRKGVEHGMKVQRIDNKGRGVFATQDFQRGEFVVEYSGELISIPEAYHREEKYGQDENTGCYMYYFKFNDHAYCIDATAETDRLGRLVNHSRNGNLVTKTIMVDGTPKLVLIAKTHIKAGDELLYDYGDRSKESLEHHPWLAL